MMGLAACGGGDKGTQDVGDTGGPQSTSRAFYARAIDGYLAGATVYVDLNKNYQLDAFEPRALTDNEGYFSYNHSTGTDYCTADELSQFCLRGNVSANEEVVIRVTGGYDTVTQLPFKGMLSLRSSELGRDDMRIVTPATSMVADTPESAVQAKLDALIKAGVFEGSLDDDPSEQLAITRAQASALIAQIVGEAGKQAYPATFEDVESGGWAQSYIAMAAGIVEGVGDDPSATFGSIFDNAASIAEIARLSIYAAMNSGQAAPDSFELPNASQLQSLYQGAASIVGFNEQMIAVLNGAAPTAEELKAMLRLQAVATDRLVKNPNDPELQDLGDWVRNQLAQGNGLGSDLTALGGDNIDVSALTASNFNFDPASNSISAGVTIPSEVATAFAALANQSFGVSVDKPGEQGAAVLFVGGDSGARSGDIDICVRYRGNDEDFDTTSSSDPNGAMLIGGHWSLLDDHTLTLSVDVVGGVQSLLLKAVSSGDVPDSSKYRFDFGGDLSEWSGSMPAAFAAGAVPDSDAACKDALIERFGSMN
jgi:hypothetical protein